MAFKSGDNVVCITPVGDLLPDKVYEVIKYYESVADKSYPYNAEWVKLKGLEDTPFLAYRFKIYKDDGDPYILQIGATTMPLPTLPPGFVLTASGHMVKSVDAQNQMPATVTHHPGARAGAAGTPSAPGPGGASGIANSGALKNDQSKIDLSLIPYISQVAEAKAFMVGTAKYGRYNYCKGHKSSQLVSAAMRHLNAWFEGEENDPLDGQPHLGAAKACISMILRQQELKTLKDDRYKPEPTT